MIALKTPYATFLEVRRDGAILNFFQTDIHTLIVKMQYVTFCKIHRNLLAPKTRRLRNHSDARKRSVWSPLLPSADVSAAPLSATSQRSPPLGQDVDASS